MKKRMIVFAVAALAAALACRAADAMLERAKLELLVDQAGELLAESNRKGSATHAAAYQYLFGLVYGSGTNLLSRAEGKPSTQRLTRQYRALIEQSYDAYTRVEEAAGKAAATGSSRGKSGARHRAKRIANAEKLRDKELMAVIKKWENFVIQVKRTR